MAKKKLSEAAAEILGANVASKMKGGEAFGAGHTASGVNTPGQSDKAEDMGGPVASAADSGVAAAAAAAPKATPPGATPPVGAESMKDIKKGESGRAKAQDTGIVEEKDEDEKDDEDMEKDEKEDKDEDEKEDMNEHSAAHELIKPTLGFLKMHADNDSHLHKTSHVPIAKNLEKKFKKGTYDHEKAKTLWKDHADRAADSYAKKYGEGQKGHQMFSVADRKKVADMFASDHHAEMKAGNFHTEEVEVKEEDSMGIPAVHSVSDKVKAYVQGKTGVKVEEDINAIFAGESLSESFMKKARMVYEAAVISTATKIAEDIETEYAETLEQVTEKIKDDLTEQVDDYLNYMVEEWVNENEVAIEKGLRAELTEDFISGLRNLFVEHYIDIPEEKVSVVEELSDKVEELEKKLNEEMNRNVALKKNLSESKKTQIVAKVCEGLTETQVEKIKSLAEGVEFTSEEEYTESLETLRENYFPSTAIKQTKLDEEAIEGEKTGFEETKTVNPEMDQYVKAIRKTLK